jgi:hypothetical protein
MQGQPMKFADNEYNENQALKSLTQIQGLSGRADTRGRLGSYLETLTRRFRFAATLSASPKVFEQS